MRILPGFAAILLLTSSVPIAAQNPVRTFLSTATLARQIRDLQGPQSGMPTDARALQARLATMRGDVAKFLIRQIEAYPSISECNLQKQLTTAFAIQEEGCGARLEREPGAPRVFALPGGIESRTFVVTYAWFGFYGKGGSETVLESYVWNKDHGVNRGAAVIPPAFSGLLTDTDEISWFPNPGRCWILVSGIVGGASGRVLGGSAAVFEIGPEHVKPIWSAAHGIGNVIAYAFPRGRRWEIRYADVNRVYSNLPHANLLDIYVIDSMNPIFRRLAHLPLD